MFRAVPLAQSRGREIGPTRSPRYAEMVSESESGRDANEFRSGSRLFDANL